MVGTRIAQGTTRTIRADNITDANGTPLDVTGWAVHAVARRNAVWGTVLSEWSTTPTGAQGTATSTGSTVTLQITPALSTAWNCRRVVIQAEITNPAGWVERIIDETYDVAREAVT